MENHNSLFDDLLAAFRQQQHLTLSCVGKYKEMIEESVQGMIMMLELIDTDCAETGKDFQSAAAPVVASLLSASMQYAQESATCLTDLMERLQQPNPDKVDRATVAKYRETCEKTILSFMVMDLVNNAIGDRLGFHRMKNDMTPEDFIERAKKRTEEMMKGDTETPAPSQA